LPLTDVTGLPHCYAIPAILEQHQILKMHFTVYSIG
jgi:hypothetical protein